MLPENLHILNQYLPTGAFYYVLPYFEKYAIVLKLTRARQTLLGSYFYDTENKVHQITVNHNLNPQAFLVTLLHELAHLITFHQHKRTVVAHGAEWKQIFKEVLHEFLQQKIFHQDVEQQLFKSLDNLKASSCADLNLALVLKKYDKQTEENKIVIQDLKDGDLFVYDKGRIFKRIQKIRKRYECQEIASNKTYLFYALCEVEKHISNPP